MRAKFGRRNTMATVKRIEPGPALKLGAIIYGFLGLIIGVFMACFSLVAGSLSGGSGIGMGARAFGFGMGVGAIIVAPIVYGIIGESARRLRRWCITLRLDGWAGSR
jgi:hypothetical protein